MRFNLAIIVALGAVTLIGGCTPTHHKDSASKATLPPVASHWGEAIPELDSRIGKQITVEGIAYDPQRDHRKSLAGITTDDGRFFIAKLPADSFQGKRVRVTGTLYRESSRPPAKISTSELRSSDFSPALVRAFPNGTFYGLLHEGRSWEVIETSE